MQTVDSNKEELDMHTVMIMALDNMEEDGVGLSGASAKTAMLALVREGGMPNSDIVQFGNTVFVSHRGEGDSKTKMYGRPLNVDTGRNYIKNIIKYGAYLQDKGITNYTATFSDKALLSAIKILQKKLSKTDTNLYAGKTEDGNYVLLIKIGEDPLEGIA